MLSKQLEKINEIWYNMIQQFKSFAMKQDGCPNGRNIFCISDEVHRTKLSVGSNLKKDDKGIETAYGFAQQLRWSFSNATYRGFTGALINKSIEAFGDIADSYTMKETSDYGITVRIAYES